MLVFMGRAVQAEDSTKTSDQMEDTPYIFQGS